MRRCLDVYLHEDKIGILEQSDDGQLIFSYRADYLTDNATALSVTMPLREAPFPDTVKWPPKPRPGNKLCLIDLEEESNEQTPTTAQTGV